jgi:hypothetical protein
MRKLNIIFLIFATFLLISLNITPVQSFFPKSHIKWTVDGFQQTSGGIATECKDYLDVVMDGDTGSDVGVLYYGSSDSSLIGTYIGTHAKGSGYLSCIEQAGSNTKQRCFCYGNYLHIIQDSFSHNPGGLTETYLRKFFGNNYFGHMAIERDFENKHLALIEKNNDYAIQSGKLENLNKNILNSMYTIERDKRTPNELMTLLNTMAGLDMSNTAQIFRDGYLANGFYSSVDKYRYNEQTSVPLWYYLVSGAMFLIGGAMFLFIIIAGKNRWKYFTAFTFLVICLLGLLILYSFNIFNIWSFTGVKISTWGLITTTLDVVTKLGYLSVSQNDVTIYDKVIQDKTNEFLQCGGAEYCLTVDDASGLTYKDRYGNIVTGALTEAEKPFKRVFYFLILPFTLILWIWLVLKSLGIKLRRK